MPVRELADASYRYRSWRPVGVVGLVVAANADSRTPHGCQREARGGETNFTSPNNQKVLVQLTSRRQQPGHGTSHTALAMQAAT